VVEQITLDLGRVARLPRPLQGLIEEQDPGMLRAHLDVVARVIEASRHVALAGAHPAAEKDPVSGQTIHTPEHHIAVLRFACGVVQGGQAQQRHVEGVRVDVFAQIVQMLVSRSELLHGRVVTGVDGFRIRSQPLVPLEQRLLAPLDEAGVARPLTQQDDGLQDERAFSAIVTIARVTACQRELSRLRPPGADDVLAQAARRLQRDLALQQIGADQQAVQHIVHLVQLHAAHGVAMEARRDPQVTILLLALGQSFDQLVHSVQQRVVIRDQSSIG